MRMTRRISSSMHQMSREQLKQEIDLVPTPYNIQYKITYEHRDLCRAISHSMPVALILKTRLAHPRMASCCTTVTENLALSHQYRRITALLMPQLLTATLSVEKRQYPARETCTGSQTIRGVRAHPRREAALVALLLGRADPGAVYAASCELRAMMANPVVKKKKHSDARTSLCVNSFIDIKTVFKLQPRVERQSLYFTRQKVCFSPVNSVNHNFQRYQLRGR